MNPLWFVARDKQKQGPFSPDQLRTQVASGELKPQDMLLLEGQTKWVQAATVTDLFPTGTAVAVSPDVSKNPPAAKAATPASSSNKGMLIAVLAIACVPLVLVLAGGVFAGIWFFKSSSPEPSREAEVTANLTSAEPAREETARPNNPDGIGEAKEEPRPAAPIPAKEEPRPAGPAQPKEEPRPKARVEAKPSPRPAAEPDVEALVKLLSQDVMVGSKTYRRPADAEWIAAIKKLKSSSNPAVAAAVKALTASQGTVTGRAYAITLNMKVRSESRARMRKLVESGHTNLMGILDKWGDDQQLRDAVEAGFMTRAEADAYAMTRDRAEADTNKTWGTILENAAREMVAEQDVRTIRKRAEVLEGHVFAEHLVAAVRARAGARTEETPLELKVGLLPDRTYYDEELGLVCGLSKAKQELTNVTLLLTVKGPVASRYVAVFLPRLAPGESFRLIPFACGTRELRATSFKKVPAEAVGRYSIWCDQLTLENQPLSEEATKHGALAYAVHQIPPRAVYLADPVPNRRKYPGGPVEEYCRYGLAITEIKPRVTGYEVKARLDRYNVHDKSKLAESATLTGWLHKSPVDERGARVKPDLLCDLRGDGKRVQLHGTIMPSGELILIPDSAPLQYRDLVLVEGSRQKLRDK